MIRSSREDHQQWRIGDVLITRVEDAVWPVELSWLVPDATPKAVSQLRHLIDHRHLAKGADIISLPFAGFVIDVGPERILVDTCLGSARQRVGETSAFISNLTAAGYAPESIDVVVCTHFHVDHIGGNTTLQNGKRQATFPNARYLFSAEEWEWASTSMAGHDPLFGAVDDEVKCLLDTGCGELVAATHSINERVRLISSHGHSPGHVCVLVESENARAIVTGDAIHHPVQVIRPNWRSNGDVSTSGAAETRSNLVATLLETETLVLGSHFANPAAGYIRRRGNAACFLPVSEGIIRYERDGSNDPAG